MNRPALRLAGALLALVAAAAVLAVTAAGLVGLAVALVLTEPWSQGRMVAAGFLTTGVALLLAAHVLDQHAVANAAERARDGRGRAARHRGLGGPVTVATDVPRLADLLPATIAEMGRRAARPDFDRWAAQVQGCGHCSRPIRLRGSSTTRTSDGRLVDGYDSRTEPDGVAYVRCGNRRATSARPARTSTRATCGTCSTPAPPAASRTSPTLSPTHPLDFVTLTAPSFGRVHTTRGPGRPCHPRSRRPTFCPHGRPEHCPRVHRDDDPDLGTPLCPDCYDYAGQVAFNWHAPELWRRFTITLRRRLADLLGIPRTQLQGVGHRELREGGRVPTPRRRPLPRPRPRRRSRRRLPARPPLRSPSSS